MAVVHAPVRRRLRAALRPEGIFFFTEAIFIAIYIYGWKHLSGWVHFWTGVPVAIAGLGGAWSVVAANSWMNQPLRGAHRAVRPLAVGAVVAMIWGWGAAQYRYLLPETLTIEQGAGASSTLTAVLVLFGVAVAIVLPALALLYVLDQRSLLSEEAERRPPPVARS